MRTGRPITKTLIKYNSNSSEENDDEEKAPIDIEFTEQKAGPENVIDFRWSNVHKEDEENIALAKFIENYKSKLMKKISQ